MTRSKNEVRVAQAQRMYRAGKTIGEIARLLGVTETTAHMWADPAYRQKRLAQIRECQRIKRKPPSPISISKPEYDPKPAVVDPRDPEEIMRRAIELRMRGYRAQAIAALLRVPYRKVEEALR
jgi:predicted transcriptional regulator